MKKYHPKMEGYYLPFLEAISNRPLLEDFNRQGLEVYLH